MDCTPAAQRRAALPQGRTAALPEIRAAPCPDAGQARPGARGAGRLEVEVVDGASAAVGCASGTPLRLFLPRPRGPAVWAVAASHGGGLVGGDEVAVAVSVGPGAALCLGTQAETKVYRPAPGAAPARQTLRAQVAAGGLLALLPDPVSPYAGARYQQDQRFALEPGASLVVLDAVTAGRAARGERWAFAQHAARNEIVLRPRQRPPAGGYAQDEREELVLADALRLCAAEGPPLPARLDGFELLATVVALGPRVAEGARAALETVSAAPADGAAPVLAAASPLRDGVLLRLASRTVEDGMAAVRRHLAFLAGPLDGDPLLRRP